MPRIKNWSRCEVDFGNMAWCHDKLQLIVFIEWIQRGYWSVALLDERGRRRPIANTSDEESARFYAVRWMREHPDGN